MACIISTSTSPDTSTKSPFPGLLTIKKSLSFTIGIKKETREVTEITIDQKNWNIGIADGISSTPDVEDIHKYIQNYQSCYNMPNSELREILLRDLNQELTEEQVTYLTTVREYILSKLA